jgi:hypothetical protein
MPEKDVMDSVREAVNETLKETGFVPEGDSPATVPVVATTEETTETSEETPTPTSETAPEATPEETPEATPEAPVPETKEKPPVEDFRPSAEELEAIDKDPNLRKVYRSMVRGFQKKTTELATKQKEAESALQVVATIRQDPVKALRTMAAAAGIRLAEDPVPKVSETPVEKTMQERLKENLTARIGAEAAEVLAPVLYDAVESIAGEKLAPVQRALDENKKATAEQALRAGIAEFGSKVIEDGGEWDEDVEKEMAALIGKVVPGKDTTLPEFLDVLYDRVQSTRRKIGQTTEQITRIRRAASSVEPVRPSRPPAAGPKPIAPGMSAKEATALAVAQAKEELAKA